MQSLRTSWLFFSLGVLLSSHTTFANNDIDRNVVAFNFGVTFGGFYEAKYQKTISSFASLVAPVSYYNSGWSIYKMACVGYGGFLGIGAKLYISGNPWTGGMYFEPLVKPGIMFHPEETGLFEPIVRSSLSIGFDHFFENGIFVDLSLGMDYYFLLNRKENGHFGYGQRFTRPIATVGVGHAW